MSKGKEIWEKWEYPENNIRRIGTPSVNDLCVEQNVMATTSAGLKQSKFKDMWKLAYKNANWIKTTKITVTRISDAIIGVSCAIKASQKVV